MISRRLLRGASVFLPGHLYLTLAFGNSLDATHQTNHPTGDHLGPLRAYLRGSYRVIKTFPDGEQVWERK